MVKMRTIVRLENVSKWFGEVVAVNNLTCDLKGGITGFLGPNGAGKTTTLKMINGIIAPNLGRVTVFGEDPWDNMELRKKIGVVFEMGNLYDWMTGEDFVRTMGRLSGLRSEDLDKGVERALKIANLYEAKNRRLKGYSHGMRQKIKISQAIVHDPQILILDEPLGGLDPISRRYISDLIRDWEKEGKDLIMSSHVLHEVEAVAKKIVLLFQGKLLAQGSIEAIRRLIDERPHTIKVKIDKPKEFVKEILEYDFISSVVFLDKDSLIVRTKNPEEFYTVFPQIVANKGFEVEFMGVTDESLEAVFKYLTMRTKRTSM
ncbi:MAG: ABC transporter ATP-binding protein [Candidatus Wukongarchaeota archaeon]|nr:ABC transporter ATP-binding protein [Candidatus Wukongarchaeota archaeon]